MYFLQRKIWWVCAILYETCQLLLNDISIFFKMLKAHPDSRDYIIGSSFLNFYIPFVISIFIAIINLKFQLKNVSWGDLLIPYVYSTVSTIIFSYMFKAFKRIDTGYFLKDSSYLFISALRTDNWQEVELLIEEGNIKLEDFYKVILESFKSKRTNIKKLKDLNIEEFNYLKGKLKNHEEYKKAIGKELTARNKNKVLTNWQQKLWNNKSKTMKAI